MPHVLLQGGPIVLLCSKTLRCLGPIPQEPARAQGGMPEPHPAKAGKLLLSSHSKIAWVREAFPFTAAYLPTRPSLQQLPLFSSIFMAQALAASHPGAPPAGC